MKRSMEKEIPKKRAKLEVEEKPRSTGWFDLPFEMREMIIDEMDSKTRCRFAMCSKQCEKEVRESNNYLDGIYVYTSWKCIFVDLYYKETEDAFQRVSFKNIKNFRRSGNHKNTVENLVDGNVEETVARFLLKKVEKNRKSLRMLEIEGRDYNSYLPKINFNMLRKLEQVEMYFDNFAEFSSIIGGDEILHAQYVKMLRINLTCDQIMKFEGIRLECRSNEMNEENVNKYLKMFKNGEVHQNIEEIHIHMKYKGEVDFRNVVEGLDAQRLGLYKTGCFFGMTPRDKENKSRWIWVDYKPMVMLLIRCLKK